MIPHLKDKRNLVKNYITSKLISTNTLTDSVEKHVLFPSNISNLKDIHFNYQPRLGPPSGRFEDMENEA
ncbi:hypothetical protein D3C77_567290 [compost metagenome]